MLRPPSLTTTTDLARSLSLFAPLRLSHLVLLSLLDPPTESPVPPLRSTSPARPFSPPSLPSHNRRRTNRARHFQMQGRQTLYRHEHPQGERPSTGRGDERATSTMKRERAPSDRQGDGLDHVEVCRDRSGREPWSPSVRRLFFRRPFPPFPSFGPSLPPATDLCTTVHAHRRQHRLPMAPLGLHLGQAVPKHEGVL